MKGRQYTIRAVPARVDRELRKCAKAEGKSLNAVIVAFLAQAVYANARGTATGEIPGTWVKAGVRRNQKDRGKSTRTEMNSSSNHGKQYTIRALPVH
jgi:hypothetical protein